MRLLSGLPFTTKIKQTKQNKKQTFEKALKALLLYFKIENYWAHECSHYF